MNFCFLGSVAGEVDGKRTVRITVCPSFVKVFLVIVIVESVYTLRRVEENGRDGVEGGFPWSVRQTTVYHKFSITRDSSRKHTDILSKTKISQPSKSTLVLVAPSPNAEWAFSNCLDQNHRDQIPLSPWNIHRILIADSLPGWVDYMAYLESRLKEQVRYQSWE